MASETQNSTDIEAGRKVIETETAALSALTAAIDERFSQAVDIVTKTEGFVIVAGVGKSGHIGHKIAATLASTGTPAFFVHPTEASHGDLGMITRGSTLLALSNSGETREMRDLLIYAEREGVPIIAITAKPQSFLASKATVPLILPRTAEACPNQLAPTSSTTMTLALGDALAIAVMERTGFSREDFGLRHPGGALGMQLQRVTEYLGLHREQANPVVGKDTLLPEVLKAVSDGRLGAVSVVDDDGKLVGVVTDGDIRRAVMTHKDVQTVRAEQMMGSAPLTVRPTDRVGLAVEILETRQISQVIVTEDGTPLGVVHLKDLMQEGYI